ncbi:MAG: hypothetical protein AABZ55_04390 [Bdellovibrionota bacterium]
MKNISYLIVFVQLIIPLLITSGCAFGSRKVEDIESATDLYSAASRAPASIPSEEEQEFQVKERDYYQRAKQAREVVLGMTMEDVLRLWGHPSDVDTAGDPRLGNQKWHYFSGLTSRWGMGGARVVYFEQGLVVGWNAGQN